MIYTGQTYTEGNKPSRHYDEMWNIMLYPTQGLQFVTSHHPELAPSQDIYNHYQELKKCGQWTQWSFENWYVPAFLKEIASRPSAVQSLNYLFNHRFDKEIILLCACPKDSMCHRSIIRGMLAGACCHVSKGKDVEGISYEYTTQLIYYTKYREERERVTAGAVNRRQ